MPNLELNKIAQHFCSIHSDIDYDKYSQQLNMLYGAISESNLSKKNILNEIIAIEHDRIAQSRTNIDSRINSAIALCTEYSKIAFELAQQSLDTNQKYEITAFLQVVFDALLESGTISNQDKEDNKRLISETHLDFEYAKGNHQISSLRMAPIIRDTRRNKQK